MEREMEKKGDKPEAFDFYILYYAWITSEDEKIRQEQCKAGNVPPPKRAAIALEHDEDKWGEALSDEAHSAWSNGKSETLWSLLGHAAPHSLTSKGIIRMEHLCGPGATGPEGLTFAALAKRWALPKGQKVHDEWRKMCDELHAADAQQGTWASNP